MDVMLTKRASRASGRSLRPVARSLISRSSLAACREQLANYRLWPSAGRIADQSRSGWPALVVETLVWCFALCRDPLRAMPWRRWSGGPSRGPA